jgi:hypothetical protein
LAPILSLPEILLKLPIALAHPVQSLRAASLRALPREIEKPPSLSTDARAPESEPA